MNINIFYKDKDLSLVEELKKEAADKDWSLSKYIIWLLRNRKITNGK